MNHLSKCTVRIALAGLLLPLLAPSLRAQLGGDPSKEIKEIAEAVEEQMKKIDELLLEAGKKGQARQKPRELLKQAIEGRKIANDGIEKLIEKLNEMKSKGQSGGQGKQGQQGGQQDRNPQRQQGQKQQGSSNTTRRENENPNFVQQPGEQQQQGQQQGQQPEPGEQQQQNSQPNDGQPQGGMESKDGGQNQQGNRASEDPTGPGSKAGGEGQWGNLQPYLNFLKNRGASPKVPAKFRKYYEAYLKNKQKEGKK